MTTAILKVALLLGIMVAATVADLCGGEVYNLLTIPQFLDQLGGDTDSPRFPYVAAIAVGRW